jgi:hypothetical protein
MDTVIAHRCAGVAWTHIDTTDFAEGAFAGKENFESVPTYRGLLYPIKGGSLNYFATFSPKSIKGPPHVLQPPVCLYRVIY